MLCKRLVFLDMLYNIQNVIELEKLCFIHVSEFKVNM